MHEVQVTVSLTVVFDARVQTGCGKLESLPDVGVIEGMLADSSKQFNSASVDTGPQAAARQVEPTAASSFKASLQ